MKLTAEHLTKPIRANDHENNFNYAVQVTRVILGMIGVWPNSRFASNAKRIAIRLQNLFCIFLLIFNLVPGLLLVFLKERDLKRKIQVMGPLFNNWTTCLKYSLLVYHAKEIQSCIEQAWRDWKDTMDWNDKKVMLSKASIGRKFAIISAAFMYSSGLSYRTIMPLSKGRMLTPMNTTVRALACPSYFIIFDEQASPAYEIVFTLQFFAGVVIYSVTCGIAGLAAFFVMHVCGQLSILTSKLQCLNDISEPEDRTTAILLANIVEHQIKIKNFLKQVEEAMRYVWLLEILGTSINLCIAGYHTIMEWESSNHTATKLTITVVIVLSFIFSLFTNCYVGQLLTDQSVKVGLMSSTMNWHRLPHKRARTLIIIMAISNIPTKIFAGRMIEMSLPTFSNIIKTSVAYFNLLRKFTT